MKGSELKRSKITDELDPFKMINQHKEESESPPKEENNVDEHK